MLEIKEKIINGTTYTVRQMNGVKALKTQAKILKIIGPALIPILLNGGVVSFDENTIEKIMPALKNFDDEEIVKLILSLFDGGDVLKKGTQGEPATIDFEEDFRGKMEDVWQLVKFIIEANFSLGK